MHESSRCGRNTRNTLLVEYRLRRDSEHENETRRPGGLNRTARAREHAPVAVPNAASTTEGGVCEGEADAKELFML